MEGRWPHRAPLARVSLLSILALASLALAACSSETPVARERPNRDDKPTPVVTTRPSVESLDDVFLEREATLIPVATAQISTRQEGFVSQVAPEVGDMVHEGDFLAQIDETDTKLQLAELSAEVRRAKATVSDERRSFERSQELFEKDVLSQGELDDRKTALERALAELDEARARRGRIEVQLYGLKILAPMPGLVTRLYTESGEYLKRGDKVLELKRIDSLVALCTVSERYLGDVREGASVYVHVTAFPKRGYQGLVWKIVGDALLESRSFPVKVLLANPDETLKPGMSARVSFVRRVENGLLVPKDAVMRQDDQAYVFRVRDEHAERLAVELGTAVGDRWHIRSGVSADDLIVVTGNEDLSGGDAVTVVDLPPPGPPTLPTPRASDIATGS
jgi:membrane fusion protein (multidrug efflux system)